MYTAVTLVWGSTRAVPMIQGQVIITIAGNFRGRKKFHEFRSFVAIREGFLRKIWGCGVLWHGMSEQSAKIFSMKIAFFTNL